MTFGEERRGKRQIDHVTAAEITESVRRATNILDQAGDAQLDRLIDQLRTSPATGRDRTDEVPY
jgi:hypothetical protein